MIPGYRRHFVIRDYALGATLDSGQAFRWRSSSVTGDPLLVAPKGDVAAVIDPQAWEGVVEGRWVRLWPAPDGVEAETVVDPGDWGWLRDYLQLDADLGAILATFPPDPPLQEAVRACRGLRVLRQEPWECLASFLLSSTKQIVQIRQIVAALCARFGDPIPGPQGAGTERAFPSAVALAAASLDELRGCKAGFRARYLLDAARAVAEGRLDLGSLRTLPLEVARERLLELAGVGPKIADCVLLFAGGFAAAFPVDVWVERALRELYFADRHPVRPAELRSFSGTFFGPWGGYAQQYLFHYMRLRAGRVAAGAPSLARSSGDAD